MSTNQRRERSLKCTVVLMESGWFLLVDVSATQDIKRRVARAKVSDAGCKRAAVPYICCLLIHFCALHSPCVATSESHVQMSNNH